MLTCTHSLAHIHTPFLEGLHLGSRLRSGLGFGHDGSPGSNILSQQLEQRMALPKVRKSTKALFRTSDR
jgi:hypothetical protein